MRTRCGLSADVPNSVFCSENHSTYAPFDNRKVHRSQWARGTGRVEDDDGQGVEEVYLRAGIGVRRMALRS